MNDLTPRNPYRPLLWDPFIDDLADVLDDHSDPVYLVGGAVRDALLHRPLKDVDLAVPAGAIRLARHIANRLKGDFFALDPVRDVGRALLERPNGLLIVDDVGVRGADLAADLADRDFTINAMAVDLLGDRTLLIDPLRGENDARDKLLRQCHPGAVDSDPVRALRGVRQSAQLGFRIEPGTGAAIRAAAAHLGEISTERARDELIHMLALERPAPALRVARALGLLDPLLPELGTWSPPGAAWDAALALVERLMQITHVISYTRTEHSAASFTLGMIVMQFDRYRQQLAVHLDARWPNERPHRAALALAALLHQAPDPRALHDRLQALRLSRAEIDRITAIVRHMDAPLQVDVASPLAIHRFWRAADVAGLDAGLLALARVLAINGAQVDQDAWLVQVDRVGVLFCAWFEQYESLVQPSPLIDGGALMAALGIAPGPQVGALLDAIREAQVVGQAHTADDALRIARDLIESQGR